ncbi:hypothetical protein ABW20_dc0103375 [Dactylellina cionopaga]|nr:hypothetical protein ABW20_dc0103375 [Dactylellina cionopaga]
MKIATPLLTIFAILAASASAGRHSKRVFGKNGAELKAHVLEMSKVMEEPESKIKFLDELPADVWDRLYQLEARAGGDNGQPFYPEIGKIVKGIYDQLYNAETPSFPATLPPQTGGITFTTPAPTLTAPPANSAAPRSTGAPVAAAMEDLVKRSAKLTGARYRETFMAAVARGGYAASQVAFYNSIPQSAWDKLAELACNPYARAQYQRALNQLFSNQIPNFN